MCVLNKLNIFTMFVKFKAAYDHFDSIHEVVIDGNHYDIDKNLLFYYL